jgi:PAS domain S-box-containing protein
VRDTETGRDPIARDGQGEPLEASPQDAFPGLPTLADVLADAVVVTDMRRRIVIWNDGAERLYGIDRRDALDQPIDQVYDSTIVGAGISSIGARMLALERGAWHGRIVDRPRLGRRSGEELVIETDLSRLDGPDGQPVGVISVKRDVTASVRLERELATLSSLVTATGDARSRAAFAKRALDVVASASGADHGAIVIAQDGGGRVLAGRDVPDVVEVATVETPWSESPAIRAIATAGRVVQGPVDRLPLLAPTRLAFLEAGIKVLMVVGLHREEELIGLLTLGWRRDDVVIPSDAAWWLVATTIARGLENARLLEEVVRRVELDNEAASRFRAIDELTRLSDTVTSLDELAERSARILDHAFGAAGTAYGLLAPDGMTYSTWSLVNVKPEVADWLWASRPDVRSAFRRWRAGEGGFVEAFEPGTVPLPIVEMARASGLTGYAGFPIRIGDALIGGAATYFDRPIAELRLQRVMLDRVATALSVGLANFQLRERLDAADQRYRTLFEGSPDPLFIERLDGTVLEANHAAERVFRAERARLIGRRPSDLAVYDDPWPRHRTDRLEPGASFRIRSTGLRSDGERFPQEVDVRRIELDGEPRLLVRVRDLTDQERLQGELIQAQKMEATGQLVSGVAHELNNPIASILGFSQLIRRDAALPDDLRHNAELLVQEATRTRRIVRNLLDFTRQRPAERHPTSIRALVDSVVTLQSYSLAGGTIEVDVLVEPDLPLVELDRGQLQQVLVNLTQNAIQAIRPGGGSRVRIMAGREVRADGDRVRITVADDGPGVPPQHVARLFEAFFTTKPAHEGTGLGLPVSHGIVRSHGGELRYVPSPFGRGAAFTFDLPIRAVAIDRETVVALPSEPASDPEPVLPPPAASPPAPAEVAHARRVLVVDDEASIRVFLSKALASLGFETVTATSGEEATARALDGDYAAFVIDQQLHGMSGIEVYDAVVAARPGYADRFVIMSGDVLDPTLEGFAATTGVGLLAKPFDLETLDRTVRALVGPVGQPRGYV